MRRPVFWTLLIVGSIVAKGWWDLQPPFFMNRQMMNACAENGGRHVYAAPVEAAGFFAVTDNGCGDMCRIGFSLGYSYIEAHAEKPTLRGYALKPGLYRYSKKPAGHPQCEAFYRFAREELSIQPRPHTTCIAAEPIDETTRRFQVGRTVESEGQWEANFDRVHEYVDDVLSERRVAEVYRYVIRWRGAFLFIFPLENFKTCPESMDDGLLRLDKILIPAPIDEL